MGRWIAVSIQLALVSLLFAGSTTSDLGLYKPAVDEVGWGTSVNDNFDTLDAAIPDKRSGKTATFSSTVNLNGTTTINDGGSIRASSLTITGAAQVDGTIAQVTASSLTITGAARINGTVSQVTASSITITGESDLQGASTLQGQTLFGTGVARSTFTSAGLLQVSTATGGHFRGLDGACSQPAFSFNGADNDGDGVCLPANGRLALSLSGSQKFVLDESPAPDQGYVNIVNFGVQNTNPQFPLDVTGTANLGNQLIVGGTVTIKDNAFSIGGSTVVVGDGIFKIGGSTRPTYMENGILVQSRLNGEKVEVYQFRNSNVNHEMNGAQIDADIFGGAQILNSLNGGITHYGATESTNAFRVVANSIGADSINDQTAEPAILMSSYKVPRGGASAQFGATENIFGIANGSQIRFLLNGRGDAWHWGGATFGVNAAANNQAVIIGTNTSNQANFGRLTVMGLASDTNLVTVSSNNASAVLTIRQSGSIIHGKGCISGFTRVGIGMCVDTDGSYELLKSSTAVATAGWGTIDSTTLNGSTATIAILKVYAEHVQDATGEVNGLFCYLRQTGSGAAAATATTAATVRADLASEAGLDMNTVPVVLDANFDFDIQALKSSGATSSSTCEYYLVGYIE